MTSTHRFSVPDISCAHCETAIQGAVGAVDGVSSVIVDVGAKSVTVESNDAVTHAALVAAIDDAGYDVA